MEWNLNILTFEPKELQYVSTVAYTGNITKAARVLYVSQPALSRCIHNIENKIGMDLFDWNHLPLKPTPIGNLFLEYSRKILDMYTVMTAELSQMSPQVYGSLSIAMTQEQATAFVAPLCQAFEQKCPRITIQLQHTFRHNILRRVAGGIIDFGIISKINTDNLSMFQEEHLYSEKIYLAAPEGMIPSPCINDTGYIDLKKLFALPKEQLPWIVQDKGEDDRDRMDNLFACYNYQPHIKMVVLSNMTAFQMVANKLGVSLIKEFTLNLIRVKHPVCLYPLDFEHLEDHLVLIYRKDKKLSKTDKIFVSCLKNLPWSEL